MCIRLSSFRKWSVSQLGMIYFFFSGKNSPPLREFKTRSTEALCGESCQKPILELSWEIELHQVVACALRASPSYAGAPGNRGHFWTHLQSWKALIRPVTKNWILFFFIIDFWLMNTNIRLILYVIMMQMETNSCFCCCYFLLIKMVTASLVKLSPGTMKTLGSWPALSSATPTTATSTT